MSEPMLLQFKDKLLEPTSDAFQQAPCRRLPQDWFIPRDGHLNRLDKDKLRMGAANCFSCPVLDLCNSIASDEDRKWTVRAGSIPTVLRVGRPSRGRPFEAGHDPIGAAAAGQRVDGICKNGHDTKVLGLVGAGKRCAQCHRDRNAEQRRKFRESILKG